MLDPRDLNLGPDGLPSLMPSDIVPDCTHSSDWWKDGQKCYVCGAPPRDDLGRCEWCGEDATSVNERGEGVCREHADKEQCAAGAERDYQLRDTPVPFEF